MVRPSQFEITQRVEGPNVILSLKGELDMRTIGQLSERLEQQLHGGPKVVTVDLHELAFMDSSGLRLLIELHDRSREEGWALKLICPQQEAAALVIRATGADTALPFVQAGEA
jgi:anti-sigma B factor antagonist